MTGLEPPVIGLAKDCKHAVEGTYAGQVAAFVGKGRHDLPQWKVDESFLVKDILDGLNLAFGKLVGRLPGSPSRPRSLRFEVPVVGRP